MFATYLYNDIGMLRDAEDSFLITCVLSISQKFIVRMPSYCEQSQIWIKVISLRNCIHCIIQAVASRFQKGRTIQKIWSKSLYHSIYKLFYYIRRRRLAFCIFAMFSDHNFWQWVEWSSFSTDFMFPYGQCCRTGYVVALLHFPYTRCS